eukprot:g5931.t1
MPCMWSVYNDDHDEEEAGGDGVGRRVSRTNASLPQPSCGRTPPAASRTSPWLVKTPSQQARGSFSVSLSPITPSATAGAAAAGPSGKGTPLTHSRSAPRRLESVPAEPPSVRGRTTAAGTPEGTPELATPVTAFSASSGHAGAPVCVVRGIGIDGGGGDTGWDIDELDYDVDRGIAGRLSSARLFKIFGSKSGTDDSEDNYETDEGESYGDDNGRMFGSPAAPSPLPETNLSPQLFGDNGVLQQVPYGFSFSMKRQGASGFRPAGTTEAGAGAGAERNDIRTVSGDDGEAPALPTLATGDSSYRSALGGKEDEDNSRGSGSLRPRSAPWRSASVAGYNDNFGGGGGGVAWGDAAALRLLPTALGPPTCVSKRSSSPIPFGAGNDFEVVVPAGVGGVEWPVVVSAPPRLRRLRLCADGSLFESDARLPPVFRRERRHRARKSLKVNGRGGGGGGGAPPATATTDSSKRANMQQRTWCPDAVLYNSSDEDEDEDTAKTLGRVRSKFLQAGNTFDSGGGTPGGTLGGALKSPGVSLRTPTCSSSASATAVARASTARVKGIVQCPSRDDQHAEKREICREKERVEGETMQGRRNSAPNQEGRAGAGQRAGMVHRRQKSAPITNVAALRLGSSSFAHNLVVALEDLDEPEQAAEEDRRRRQQKIDQRDQPDYASAAAHQRGRGRFKKRSSSFGQRPWSRSRGRSQSGGGGSDTSSRRGSGTSGGGGGGSRRGSEILGKIKGMLSHEPRSSSPAVRPMSRIELHKAQLAAEAFKSPGTRLASSSFEDEPCPEDELFEGTAAKLSQKGAGRGRNRRVPGWRSRSRGAPGVGRETIMKLQ